jgi:hypothetical protein
LQHPTNAEEPFVIVIVYMDESGTHASSEKMTIGGLVGRPDQWNYFDRRWEKMLKKRNIPYFHSKSLMENYATSRPVRLFHCPRCDDR